MFRFGCLLFVAILIAIPALAAQFLPWWGIVLVILGEAALLLFGAPKLIGYLSKRFMMNLFLTKSRVLKNAALHVVSVRRVERTFVDTDDDEEEEEYDDEDEDENDGDEEDGEEWDDDLESFPDGTRFVEIEFTVTPRPGQSKMSHWEPGELMLVPFDAKVDPNADSGNDEACAARVHQIDLIDEAANSSSDFDKLIGPTRLRAVFAVPPTMTGRAKFRYYFEQFGDLMLP